MFSVGKKVPYSVMSLLKMARKSASLKQKLESTPSCKYPSWCSAKQGDRKVMHDEVLNRSYRCAGKDSKRIKNDFLHLSALKKYIFLETQM